MTHKNNPTGLKLSEQELLRYERSVGLLSQGIKQSRQTHIHADWFAGRALMGLAPASRDRDNSMNLVQGMVRGAALLSLFTVQNPNNPHAVELVLAQIKLDAITPLYDMLSAVTQAGILGYKEEDMRTAVNDTLTMKALETLTCNHAEELPIEVAPVDIRRHAGALTAIYLQAIMEMEVAAANFSAWEGQHEEAAKNSAEEQLNAVLRTVQTKGTA